MTDRMIQVPESEMLDERYYLWLDLETTGLDPVEDPICEVAATLTACGPRFLEMDSQWGAVQMTEKISDRLDKNDFVFAMHESSGLREAMLTSDTTLDNLDHGINAMLTKHLGTKFRGHVHLAGSGVAHFDLRRVNDQMPWTAKWLHWRPLDVGQLEEWRKLAGLPTFDEANPEQADRKTHRALEDIGYHLDEARWYLREMTDVQGGFLVDGEPQ